MTRLTYIEKIMRQIYGDFPNDDSSITYNLVNVWVNEGTALAAKQNQKDNISIDGISFVSNSFYTSYKGRTVVADEQFTWKISLPEIPIAIGSNQGISVLQLKDSNGQLSLPLIPLSENQRGYFQTMRPIPNKLIYYYEGLFVYIISTLLLNQYTASVTMISGGDFTNLDSELNVPQDYMPVIDAYVSKMLMAERFAPQDLSNDGTDIATAATR
jgi:hypothetical protein